MTKSKPKGKTGNAAQLKGRRLPKTREEWIFWMKRKGDISLCPFCGTH